MESVFKGHGVAWAGAVIFFCAAFSIHSQNLVQNGNFEAGGGSFADWTVSHTINQTQYPYSGPTISTGGFNDPYYARFTQEQSGSGDILSQNVATVPGETYDIEFSAEDGAGHNQETDFSFGNFMANLGAAFSTGPGEWLAGWTNFNFLVTATEVETDLSFLIYADAGSEFGVDDISVVAKPQLQACVMGGKFQLSVTNTCGPVVIQATTNMINWVSIYTNTAPFTFTDACKCPHCFYRAAIISN